MFFEWIKYKEADELSFRLSIVSLSEAASESCWTLQPGF